MLVSRGTRLPSPFKPPKNIYRGWERQDKTGPLDRKVNYIPVCSLLFRKIHNRVGGWPHPDPQGRLNLAQDVSPGLDLERTTSPAGTAENRPRRNPGQPSAVPAGLSLKKGLPHISHAELLQGYKGRKKRTSGVEGVRFVFLSRALRLSSAPKRPDPHKPEPPQ
jgi:hypothetical protein